MARFSMSEADNYGSSGGDISFFSLKGDGDTARVRFMYNSAQDVEGFAVHQIEIDGKRRYVNCIRGDYNSPVSDCPLCAAGNNQLAKFYIPVYDVDSKQVKIWERGKKFVQTKIGGICSRYATPRLVAHQFDVERHGKPGSTETDYMLYEVGGGDDTTIEDLPEVPNVLGTILMDKSADEMNYFIENGSFPTSSIQRNDSYEEERPTRRTPANTGRRSDAF